MKRVLASLLLACAFSVALPAQTSLSQGAAPDKIEDRDAKHSEIRKLIELTGAANVSTQVVQQIVEPIRREFPEVPAEFWDSFIKEVRADELVDLVVPLYEKYYTRGEIHDLTVFYQSPVGQKTVRVLPKLSAEAISVGQHWGRTVAERAINKLKQQGYDKTSSLAPEKSPSGR